MNIGEECRLTIVKVNVILWMTLDDVSVSSGSPGMDKSRAQHVLARIDDILRWEQSVEAKKDQRFAELGKCLCEVRN